jgi:hypothetical protein
MQRVRLLEPPTGDFWHVEIVGAKLVEVEECRHPPGQFKKKWQQEIYRVGSFRIILKCG